MHVCVCIYVRVYQGLQGSTNSYMLAIAFSYASTNLGPSMFTVMFFFIPFILTKHSLRNFMDQMSKSLEDLVNV